MLCSWFLEVEEELSESVKGMRGSTGEKEWQVAKSEGEREGLDDGRPGDAASFADGQRTVLAGGVRGQLGHGLVSVCVDASTISANDYINLSINPN